MGLHSGQAEPLAGPGTGFKSSPNIYISSCGIIKPRTSQVMLMVKNPPTKAGDIKRCGFDHNPGQEDLEEEGMAFIPVFLPYENPMDGEPGRLQVIRFQSGAQLKQVSTHKIYVYIFVFFSSCPRAPNISMWNFHE